MKKDFERWNQKKKRIDKINRRPFFHTRDIWWCSVGVNVGFEQNGRGEDFLRPILIFQKFNNEILWAIPLTLTNKENKYYFRFVCNNKWSTAILSQIKLMDAARLSHQIGTMSENEFGVLKQKFKALLP